MSLIAPSRIEEEYDSDYDYDFSESFKSSLSMSIESHGSIINPMSSSLSAQLDEEAQKKRIRERKLSLSMLYDNGGAELHEPQMGEVNALTFDDKEEDEDFQKLSFTKTRKMSDATGW